MCCDPAQHGESCPCHGVTASFLALLPDIMCESDGFDGGNVWARYASLVSKLEPEYRKVVAAARESGETKPKRAMMDVRYHQSSEDLIARWLEGRDVRPEDRFVHTTPVWGERVWGNWSESWVILNSNL